MGSGRNVGVELIWQAGPQRDMGCLSSSACQPLLGLDQPRATPHTRTAQPCLLASSKSRGGSGALS